VGVSEGVALVDPVGDSVGVGVLEMVAVEEGDEPRVREEVGEAVRVGVPVCVTEAVDLADTVTPAREGVGVFEEVGDALALPTPPPPRQVLTVGMAEEVRRREEVEARRLRRASAASSSGVPARVNAPVGAPCATGSDVCGQPPTCGGSRRRTMASSRGAGVAWRPRRGARAHQVMLVALPQGRVAAQEQFIPYEAPQARPLPQSTSRLRSDSPKACGPRGQARRLLSGGSCAGREASRACGRRRGMGGRWRRWRGRAPSR
jgi:hypothetical protein